MVLVFTLLVSSRKYINFNAYFIKKRINFDTEFRLSLIETLLYLIPKEKTILDTPYSEILNKNLTFFVKTKLTNEKYF